jgi:hypothetical protein
VEVGIAAVLLMVGVGSAVRSLRETTAGGSAVDRLLVAIHDAAKAGFWLSAAAVFAGYAFLEEPQRIQVFVLVPVAMAGLRLVTAYLLSRSS